MPTVAVLMSTYNGEKYIREQLESIFHQRGVHVRLFVRDDGSSDSTIAILKEYAKSYPIEILLDRENVGPGESFMRLVYRYADDPSLDCYAFADQDDIWLEDKLNTAVHRISDCGYCGPILYSSNQYLYIDGENIGYRHKEPQRTDLISHLTKNTIAGCTFVFNKALAQLVNDADRPNPSIIKYRLHDAWLMLVAIACGHVIYDEKSNMLYRIHQENTVGVKGISLKNRLGRLQRYVVKRDDSNLRMITAQELLRLFPQISEDNRQILRLYADYQNSWKDKKALVSNRKIRNDCAENSIAFAIKILTDFV